VFKPLTIPSKESVFGSQVSSRGRAVYWLGEGSILVGAVKAEVKKMQCWLWQPHPLQHNIAPVGWRRLLHTVSADQPAGCIAAGPAAVGPLPECIRHRALLLRSVPCVLLPWQAGQRC
jgi:hypothetical protein